MIEPKYDVELELNLAGPQGNAFSVMGSVASYLKQLEVPKKEIEKWRKEAMSGDYEHLLRTCAGMVRLIDISGMYDEDFNKSDYYEATESEFSEKTKKRKKRG